MEFLPGMTRRITFPSDKLVPYQKLLDTKSTLQRKIILLATASITDGNIFNNGLYQNIFLLYRLAEVMGYMPLFVVNSRP